MRPPKIVKLKDLELSTDPLEPEQIEGNTVDSFVRVRGKFTGPFSSLLWSAVPVKTADDGRFEIFVRLLGNITPVEFTSVDAYGNPTKDRYEIVFRDWEPYLFNVREKARMDLNFAPAPFTAGLGFSKISYSETGNPLGPIDYSALSLTGKLNYIRPFFSRRWTIGAGGFFTVLPLTQSSAQSIDATVRFLGVNVRLGYQFLPGISPWKISLNFGTYYTTMFVTGDQFGFNSLSGPQLYPVVQRSLANGQAIRGYLKIAPLASNVSALTLSSRELAAGGEYVYQFSQGRPRSVQLDLSDLKIIVTKNPYQSMSVKTVSLSLSYGL